MSPKTTYLKIKTTTRKNILLISTAALIVAFLIPLFIFREFHFFPQLIGAVLSLFYLWKGEKDRGLMRENTQQTSVDEFFGRMVQRGLIIAVSLVIGILVFRASRAVFITALLASYAAVLLYELTLIDHESVIEEPPRKEHNERSHLPYEDEAP